MYMRSGRGCALDHSVSQSSVAAPEPLLRLGAAPWNTSPLRARYARSAQVLHPHAQEHRRVHSPLGSTRSRRGGRVRTGSAHTRRGGPRLGGEQSEIGRRGRGIGR